MKNKVDIYFSIERIYYKAIQRLPWDININEWESSGENTLKIKSGVSRHTVVFVRSGGFDFAIKEISPEISKKEILKYEEILKKGVHTLVPIGYVIRKEEPIVINLPSMLQYENADIAYTVTLIASKVLPDSTLVSYAFQEKNRKKIWDAIIELFVDLHINNIYWGDASLANLLIRFDKDELPDGKKITKLRAILADAETVEIYENISDSMRNADLDFFLESMEWFYEDLKSDDLNQDDSLQKCKQYIRENYEKYFSLTKIAKQFESDTGLNFKKDFLCFPRLDLIKLLNKQILEHRWYLSEKHKKEISVKDAAIEWYEKVYTPIKELFIDHDILSHFPEKSILDVYVEIMEHKYYISEKLGRDVGIVYSMEDYYKRYSENLPLIEKILSLAKSLLKIIGIE